MDITSSTMAIDAPTFGSHLPELLEMIASADFIAIDLETSGTKEKLATDLSDKTVAQIYEEISTNASGFGSLQMGLTIARWEETRYRTCTVTIPISPLVATKTSEQREMAKIVDRKTGISQAVLGRMLQNKLHATEVLDNSIPYLSRLELAAVEDWHFVELPGGCDDIDIKAEDLDTVDHLFEQITSWKEHDWSKGKSLSIYEPRGGPIRKSTVRLLKHLLYHKQGLTSIEWIQSADCITISPFPHCAVNTKRTGTIDQQAGLLYLAESLTSDCRLETHLDGFHLPALLGFQGFWHGESPDIEKLRAVLRKLKSSKAILAGHDILHDLCFLYAMFIGPLPYSMNAFAQEAHRLWPRVLDTAVLMVPVASTGEPLPSLSQLVEPDPHSDQRKKKSLDGGGNPLVGEHDAAHNSLMIMLLLLKKAAKLRSIGLKQEAVCTNGRQTDNAKESCAAVPLPHFNDLFWASFLNRVRVANAGILELKLATTQKKLSDLFFDSTDDNEEDVRAWASTKDLNDWGCGSDTQHAERPPPASKVEVRDFNPYYSRENVATPKPGRWGANTKDEAITSWRTSDPAPDESDSMRPYPRTNGWFTTHQPFVDASSLTAEKKDPMPDAWCSWGVRVAESDAQNIPRHPSDVREEAGNDYVVLPSPKTNKSTGWDG